MTQRNPSAITTTLEVDPPLIQNAGFEFDKHDRQFLDNQIRGVQQHLVNALIRGRHATYILVDGASPALVAGDNVCFSAETLEPRVTKCTAATLTDAVAAFGVVVLPAPPGSYALIAFGGVLPRVITGLALNAAGFVRVNTTTGRCERVATLGSGDYGIGVVSKSAQMLVVPGLGVAGTSGLVLPSAIENDVWGSDGLGGFKNLGPGATVPAGVARDVITLNGSGGFVATKPYLTGLQSSFTFAADANETLDATKSQSTILIINDGVIAAARTITVNRGPASATGGDQIRVVNNNSQNVLVKWATGTAISVPAGKSLDIGSDGTNAINLFEEATGGSESTTVVNLGASGGRIYESLVGSEIRLRRIVAGANVAVTENANDLTIAASGGGGFTAGNDLSGTSSSQNVEALTGAAGIVTVRSGAPAIQWQTATSAPTINQAANATNGATAQNLAIAAQNATGTTSTGGNLVLSAGSGTSANGAVRIAVNGSTGVQITPSNSGQSIYQVVAGATSTLFQHASNTSNGATGGALTVQAQNATGTTSTGGALNLTSGTGTSVAGNVNIQTGGTTRLQLTPTQAAGDLLKSDGTTFGRWARGSALQLVRVNSGGTDLEWWTLSVALGSQVSGTLPISNGGTGVTALPGSSGQLLINNGGALGATANFVSSSGGLVGNNSAFLSFGTSTATAGTIRLPDGGAINGYGSGSGDYRLLTWAASPTYTATFGEIQTSATACTSTGFDFYVSNAVRASLTSSAASFAVPVGGHAGLSQPLRFKTASINCAAGGTIPAIPSQYECLFLRLTGSPSSSFTLVLPALDGCLFHITNSTGQTVTVKKSGGTGVTIVGIVGEGNKRFVYYDGSDYAYTENEFI